MSLLRCLVKKEFKSSTSFRANFMIELIFSFLYISLNVYIWKGLYDGSNSITIKDVSLNEMIIYFIISGITNTFISSDVMFKLNKEIHDGTILQYLLLPLQTSFYKLCQSLSINIAKFFYASLPPVLVAAFFFRVSVSFSFDNIAIYTVSVFLGFLINYQFNFLLGISAIWFGNSFFLRTLNSVLFNLFSGYFVPLWFFPTWLLSISDFLPFKYMLFIPNSFLLGNIAPESCLLVIGIQIFWTIVLTFCSNILWHLGKRKLVIAGN